MDDLPDVDTINTKKFRFNSKSFHLTYDKCHIPLLELVNKFTKYGKGLRFFSGCHERGKHGTNNHTHFFGEWNERCNVASARFFDFANPGLRDVSGGDGGEIKSSYHPNVKRVSSKLHKKRIWTYHAKEGATRLCSEGKPFCDGDTYQRIIDAEDLQTAIEEAGVNIRTVSDVINIRRQKRKREPYKHKYPEAEWTIPSFQECNDRCVFIRGPSGSGKTQWAIHQFENPLIVRHLDKLSEFDPAVHDGIVFDDMSFAHLPRESVIALVDWEEESDVHIRYRTVSIPAYTKKIFTSNKEFEDVFPGDGFGAIRRRFSRCINCLGCIFRRRQRDESSVGVSSQVPQSQESDGQDNREHEELCSGSYASLKDFIVDDDDVDWISLSQISN